MWWADAKPGLIAYLGDSGPQLVAPDGTCVAPGADDCRSLASQVDWVKRCERDLAHARVSPPRVIVADRWLRHATLPWNSDLLRTAPALAYAREELEEAFAASLEDWEIQRQPGPFGAPQLVCAWPPELARLATPRARGAIRWKRTSALLAVTRSLAPWLVADDAIHVSDGLTHTARFMGGQLEAVIVHPRRRSPAPVHMQASDAGARQWHVDLGAACGLRAPPDVTSPVPPLLDRAALLGWMARA